ncbi:PAS domain-containing protein [Flavobacteriales bacterium]|nr:PAS domain-containing protein [Flavobacteriales bacterium]
MGSWSLNPADNIIIWSTELFKIHGVEKQPLSVDFIRGLTHPEDLHLFDTGFATLANGKNTDFIYRVVTPSGEVKHVRGVGKITNLEIVYMFGTVQDITERVLAQQELEARTVQRDLLLSTSKIGVWHWTVGNNKIIWDEGCAKIFDEFVPDLTAERYYELIHPDDRDYVRKRLFEGLKKGDYTAEYRLTKNDKTTFVLSRGRATLDEEGRATRMEGIIIDMTDLKKAEEQIKTLSLVASETVNGVLIHDPDGKIIWANKGFTKITGYANEEVVGKEPWSILSGEETNQKLVELTYVSLSKGKTFSSDNRLVTKYGEVVWIHTTFTPVIDDEGNLTKIVSIGTDITKQKEFEGLQREMVARLEKANAELEKNGKD